MKRILHVFPDRGVLMHHIDNLVCSKRDLVFDRSADVYVAEDGTRHHCYVIKEHDDIHQFIGHEFSAFEKHGSFSHLGPEDDNYLDSWLACRVRQGAA